MLLVAAGPAAARLAAGSRGVGGQLFGITSRSSSSSSSSQFFSRSRISPSSLRTKRFGSRSSFSTETKKAQTVASDAILEAAAESTSAEAAGKAGTSSSTVPTAAIPAANTPLKAPLPVWQRLGHVSAFFRFYSRSQASRPYVTQFISSLVIFAAGDLGAQYIGGDDYDAKRTLRVLAISAGSSVAAYRWLVFIGKNFNYTSKLLSLGTKVLVNQAVYAPVFGGYYFAMQSVLSGDSASQTLDRVATALPVSIKSSWMFWPPVTAMTFAFVPGAYQAVTLAGVATCWQTYLSYLNKSTDRSIAAVPEQVSAQAVAA